MIGRLDENRAFAWAERYFGDWKAQGTPVADTPPARVEAPVQHVLIERPGSVQSAIRIGRPAFAASGDDAIPAAIADAVLGGGSTGRLFQSLREEKGYTYGAYSDFSSNRAGGRFTARADVRNEVTGPALTEFFRQMQMLIDEPVAAPELERAKRFTGGVYLFRNQLQGAVANSLATNWLIGLPSDYLGQFVPRTSAVTAAQVQAIARKYFDPKSLSVVIVGDKAVADQLQAWGAFAAAPK
jgi:zinc protease